MQYISIRALIRVIERVINKKKSCVNLFVLSACHMARPRVLEGCQNRQYCIYSLSGMFLLLQVTPGVMNTAVPGAVIHHPLLPLWQFILLYWPFLIVSYLGTFQAWMKMQELFSHWIYPVYTTCRHCGDATALPLSCMYFVWIWVVSQGAVSTVRKKKVFTGLCSLVKIKVHPVISSLQNRL